MPITKSAIKKQRVDKRRTAVNRAVRSKTKSAVREARANPSAETLKEMYSALDRAVKSKIVPKNRAARVKSRLLARVKSGGAKSPFGKSKKATKK